MQAIENLTDASNQLTKPRLEDGSIVTLEVKYLAAIQRWQISVSHNEFQVNGIILSSGFNILRAWRHIIPFGISCLTTDTADPTYIDDFTTARATIFILNEDEVQQIEDEIFGVRQ